MLRLSFGTERDAQVAFDRINAIHNRVHGHLPEAAGVFPAGTPYSAHDPALLTWVHATLVHMNLRVYDSSWTTWPPRTGTATVPRLPR